MVHPFGDQPLRSGLLNSRACGKLALFESVSKGYTSQEKDLFPWSVVENDPAGRCSVIVRDAHALKGREARGSLRCGGVNVGSSGGGGAFLEKGGLEKNPIAKGATSSRTASDERKIAALSR